MTPKRLLTAAAAIALMAGVAHAQTAPETAPAAQAPAATSPVVAKGDLIQTAQASGQFSTFLKAVSSVNLTSVLKTNQNLTLFAPTDAAFAALPADQRDKLMAPENGPLLQKVLTYHLINAKVDSSKITGAKGEVASVEGSPLMLDGSGATPMVDGANIVQADVMASNGVLHVIDKVLLPKDVPGLQAASAPAATDAGATMNVAANEQVSPPAPAEQAGAQVPTATNPTPVAPATSTDMAADPAASPSAMAAPAVGVSASGVVPASSQTPDAQASLKAGDPNVVSNGPVADTTANRAKYGAPMSNAGKRTTPKGN
ncbi:fasciclin domain-containing protein [Caulobacter segnis]|uniref:Beta-Ig-H3/fasciclin n=2 Tax=Caulobacter segnis TaxID=88688 RepID=D5VJ35_CAUST|nr:fasciclin domain-containing protein [Caulobacter segnis]ADG10123.1 beta-Ig-H3/fasciclin [Caulobacter segnis ATCC 21756]AVQ01872.1 fasciclin domain-containing protein [Caulobacter segnis]